mmetsp:Transcript_27128/g.72332  ORF Transcript_27128/g.72332 Transcript_27128/m.72332 type:complete len:594 (-) Transcript_27128:2090-3871(-)
MSSRSSWSIAKVEKPSRTRRSSSSRPSWPLRSACATSCRAAAAAAASCAAPGGTSGARGLHMGGLAGRAGTSFAVCAARCAAFDAGGISAPTLPRMPEPPGAVPPPCSCGASAFIFPKAGSPGPSGIPGFTFGLGATIAGPFPTGEAPFARASADACKASASARRAAAAACPGAGFGDGDIMLPEAPPTPGDIGGLTMVPGATMALAAAGGAIMPGAAMPGAAMPGAAMPGAVMPRGLGCTTPGPAMTGATMPGAIMPGGDVPGMPGAAAPAFANCVDEEDACSCSLFHSSHLASFSFLQASHSSCDQLLPPPSSPRPRLRERERPRPRPPRPPPLMEPVRPSMCTHWLRLSSKDTPMPVRFLRILSAVMKSLFLRAVSRLATHFWICSSVASSSRSNGSSSSPASGPLARPSASSSSSSEPLPFPLPRFLPRFLRPPGGLRLRRAAASLSLSSNRESRRSFFAGSGGLPASAGSSSFCSGMLGGGASLTPAVIQDGSVRPRPRPAATTWRCGPASGSGSLFFQAGSGRPRPAGPRTGDSSFFFPLLFVLSLTFFSPFFTPFFFPSAFAAPSLPSWPSAAFFSTTFLTAESSG